MPQPRYVVVESTDLITRTKSYKIYERFGKIRPPIEKGIPTREQAEARILELEKVAEAKP